MSSFESFYGGRQGASIIIVKRFDGIDIPEKTRFRCKWFAQDGNSKFYVPLIERTKDNYNSYPNFDAIPCDGVTTVTSAEGVVSTPLPIEYAEGMKQCFEKGGLTASTVGYGEYVLIDTVSGFGEHNNPENGRVYRRGMNYDQDLGGAEYIGTIVGPEGKVPRIDMGEISAIEQQPTHTVLDYMMHEGDAREGIVPGKYDKDGVTKFNDSVTYGWAHVKDSYGNINRMLIGFKFPYLVAETTSSSRSAYYTQEDYDLGRITDESLIGTRIKDEQNFELFVDNGFNSDDRDPTHGDTGHAFYRRWKLAIPHGVKGDAQTQLEIIPTKMRTGASLWNSEDITQPPVDVADEDTIVIVDDTPFPHDCVYPYDNSSAIVAAKKVSDPSTIYYAKIEDTYMLKVRYRQTNYDEHGDGSDYQMIDLGNYNTIRKIWLADDGYLWVRYNSDEDRYVNAENNPIKWIKDVDTDEQGTVTVTYNTLDGDGNNEKKVMTKKVDWVNSIALANKDNPATYDDMGGVGLKSGHFRIIYNNETVANKTNTWVDPDGKSHAIWETDITWPQSVSLDDAGLLKFLYNNNLYYNKKIYTDPDEGSYSFSIPWITKALIKQNGEFTLTYNNEVNAKRYPAEEWDSETHTWTTILNFVDHVTIDEDGKIHFWYSNGKEAPNTGYANIRIKYLVDVAIDTGIDEASPYPFTGEGSGDQKVEFTWNTEQQEAGKKDKTKVGAPLNYIMETIVTSYDPKAPNTPANHLLVLYSDPAYRQWLVDNYRTTDPKTNKIWSYTSQKFQQQDPQDPSATIFVTRNDWFDLGYVKGEPGGLHIIGEYSLQTGETYKDYLDDNIPPENMPGNTFEDRGWAYLISTDHGDGTVTKVIYTYDYIHKKWVTVGSLDEALVDPTLTIIMDSSTVDSETGHIIPADNFYRDLPKDYGFWLVKSSIKTVY